MPRTQRTPNGIGATFDEAREAFEARLADTAAAGEPRPIFRRGATIAICMREICDVGKRREATVANPDLNDALSLRAKVR
jgi:hypothetical protein